MDGGGEVIKPTADSQDEIKSKTPYTEIFVSAFPYYLSIGMSAEEYWHGAAFLTEAYREADKLRFEERNTEYWLQGLYNYKGVKSAIDSFAWGLGGGKGEKPSGYFEYKIPFTENEKAEEKQRNVEKTLKFFADGQNKVGVDTNG